MFAAFSYNSLLLNGKEQLEHSVKFLLLSSMEERRGLEQHLIRFDDISRTTEKCCGEHTHPYMNRLLRNDTDNKIGFATL